MTMIDDRGERSFAGEGRAALDRRPVFLPSEIDPTVFDEAFLRQLERLLLLLRKPVRGGLKGGRRSVKRGQSIEFADYREYSLGDDLRQLDWNVLARLEKLFVKLFIEEEDVTITILLDGSDTSASRPRTRSRSASSVGGSPEDAPPFVAPAASSGCWPNCRRSGPRTARRIWLRRLVTPRRSCPGEGSSFSYPISSILPPTG